MAKAEKRKAQHAQREKQQIASAERRNMSIDAYKMSVKQRKLGKKTAGQVTRAKKERQKAKKDAAAGDAMEIG
jgi:hypothetical protein